MRYSGLQSAPCLLLLALFLLLAGCGNDMGDLKEYVAEVKARKSTDIEPIPQIRPYRAYTYIPADRIDPFEPFRAPSNQPTRTANSGLQPNPNRNKEALEEFPLDALRMVGTLEVGDTRYALVRSPDGIVHRVSSGNYMGENYGRVVAVTDNEVQLAEIVPDGFGGYTERRAELALSQ